MIVRIKMNPCNRIISSRISFTLTTNTVCDEMIPYDHHKKRIFLISLIFSFNPLLFLFVGCVSFIWLIYYSKNTGLKILITFNGMTPTFEQKINHSMFLESRLNN
ncbi:hypothetical protein RCL_jg3600.t1 [Rhizophagus clarus]|uniref:Uncharacterized protein n=1 Tax=Rhizophagus clarus TaxID=94130 RepID=A0A8H3M341_9GLOM|nr:hypothetical protein RCL_jg3600.t1 [Rhizophagus clarus]